MRSSRRCKEPGRLRSRAARQSRSGWSRDGPSNSPSNKARREKTVPPGQDRQAAPGGDGGDGFTRHARVLSSGERLVGIEDVDQVVRDAAAFRERQFRRADVEIPVDLEGIAVDDFAPELFRHEKCEIALSGARGTGHRNQRAFGRVWWYSGAGGGLVSVVGHSFGCRDVAAQPRYTI